MGNARCSRAGDKRLGAPDPQPTNVRVLAVKVVGDHGDLDEEGTDRLSVEWKGGVEESAGEPHEQSAGTHPSSSSSPPMPPPESRRSIVCQPSGFSKWTVVTCESRRTKFSCGWVWRKHCARERVTRLGQVVLACAGLDRKLLGRVRVILGVRQQERYLLLGGAGRRVSLGAEGQGRHSPATYDDRHEVRELERNAMRLRALGSADRATSSAIQLSPEASHGLSSQQGDRLPEDVLVRVPQVLDAVAILVRRDGPGGERAQRAKTGAGIMRARRRHRLEARRPPSGRLEEKRLRRGREGEARAASDGSEGARLVARSEPTWSGPSITSLVVVSLSQRSR